MRLFLSVFFLDNSENITTATATATTSITSPPLPPPKAPPTPPLPALPPPAPPLIIGNMNKDYDGTNSSCTRVLVRMIILIISIVFLHCNEFVPLSLFVYDCILIRTNIINLSITIIILAIRCCSWHYQP